MKNRSLLLRTSVARAVAMMCVAVVVTGTSSTARAAGVVGTGTAASCTDGALDTALAGGGTVTFDCGGAATIDISTGTGTKAIAADTMIDGGGLITISGGHSVLVFDVSGAKFTVKNLTIADGTGGISNFHVLDKNGVDGTLTVTNSTFAGNGFGISNSGDLTVTNSSFTGNGGGMFTIGAIVNAGSVTVSKSTFTGNGSGIGNLGTLAISDSTFSDNRASGSNGGAIENEDRGTLTVTNSTFSGNSARSATPSGGGSGGAIFNAVGATLTIGNSTLTGNIATVGSGIYGSALLSNTIVANSISGDNCAGTITDGGHNLDDGTSCGFSTANASLSHTDPQVDPAGLRDNGGPTETIALLPDSPAVDAGDQAACAAAAVNGLDQRGSVRPGVGHSSCSIGAYEADAAPEEIGTGDCDHNGAVTVDELVRGVNIALGVTTLSDCREFDCDGNGAVAIACLVQAVDNALNGSAATPVPIFVPAACEIPIPDGQDPAHVTCGFVTVPENRSHPKRRKVKLAVVVLRATGPSPAPDPIIHLGPGLGPILDGLMQTFTADFAAPLQASRDLVFFDIRGSGRSTPSVACPELLTLRDAYAVEQTIEADTTRDVASLLACHDRLVADGTDFADYTTAGIAADARDVLRALGYQQWNLYGWSQSTRIAQVLMRDSPAGEIRSIVLDSPIPLSRAHIAEYAAHLERVLRLIIRDCGADAGCAQTFPDLEQTMFGLFPALNTAPLTIEPTDPATGEPFRVVLSGDRLLNILVLALQSTAIIPFAPILSQQLASRDTSLFSVGAAQLAGLSQGDAMSQAVLCQDQVPLMTPEVLTRALQGVDPNIAHALTEGTVGVLIGPCSGWTGVTPISGPPPPLASDLRTLILSGEYDPATPPEYAHELAATLSNGTVVEFRGHGHGELYVIDAPAGQTSCAMNVMAQFVADPEHAPDTSCAAALPPPHFVGS